MSFRNGDRYQQSLFPPSLEEYVSESDPVRVYDAFVEALDFDSLGISLDENKVGNSRYNPKAMLKLLLYGYSYGIQSSRKLERAIHHNVSFMWLVGGLKPDHKTIANFRRANIKGLKQVMKQCAILCIKLELIEGNTLFLDGTKIRANASIKHTYKKSRCDKKLVKVEKRIEEILKECEAIDKQESNTSSMVELKAELADKQAIKAKVKATLQEMESEGKTSINTTDKDCVATKSRQGKHAAYNGQIVVDDRNGLIVSSDVVNEANDRKQFSNQINKAQEVLNHKCETACADAGYANTDDLAKIDAEGIKVIVPSQEQKSKQTEKPFHKNKFTYDEKNDCYWCPEGHQMKHTTNQDNKAVYAINSRKKCISCRHFGECTTAPKGRAIKRLAKEEVKEKLERQYDQKESKEVYKRRQEKVEHPFGHIKKNLGVNAFMVRGIEGVRGEMSILATNFNLSRMMTIIGTKNLMYALKAR